MKKSFNAILLFSFFFIIGYHLNAQTAIGARLGSPLSVSLKHFLSNGENSASAVELYAGTRGSFDYRWFSVSGAYQLHKPFLEDELEGLQYYFGGGASVLFWNIDYAGYSTTTFGVQGYLGVNYTFEDIPLNVSVDWVPTIFLGSGFTTGFAAGYGSLGVRYVFNR